MSENLLSQVRGYLGNETHLNTKQAAYLLGVSSRHLRRMRSRGEGPPVRRYSSRLSYRLDELIEWANGCRQTLGRA